MVGPGEAIKSTSTIGNLLDAMLFLIERMERGVQTFTSTSPPCPPANCRMASGGGI